MNGAFPVDGLSSEIFFRPSSLDGEIDGFVCASFRTALRLFPGVRCVQFTGSNNNQSLQIRRGHVNTAVHHFEELIAGRPYLIEVVAVAKDRWRAYVVRIPGVPNAMMPFYGTTPDQAAAELRRWLTRAYERAASPARSPA